MAGEFCAVVLINTRRCLRYTIRGKKTAPFYLCSNFVKSIYNEILAHTCIYTVNHKKGDSTFVIVTLENLDHVRASTYGAVRSVNGALDHAPLRCRFYTVGC